MSITALVVFVVWLLGLVLALAFEPIFALFSYLWIFYNDPQTSWWGSDLPPLRYSLFAAVAALVAATRLPVRVDAKWVSSGFSKLLIAFTIWIWLQSFWAVNVSTHVDGAILCTKYLILSYVIYRLTGSEKGVKLFLAAHVAGCFLFGWRATTMNVSGRLETIVAPGVDDSNLLAAHLVSGLTIAGFFFIGTRGYRRWFAFATLPFILNAIILTQSRGGFLAMVAAGLSGWYLAPKVHKRFVAVSGALAVVLLLMLSNEGFWARISTIIGSNSETPEETRLQILRPQVRMFLDHPFGAGHRGNALLSAKYMPPELLSNAGIRSAHNTFMAALVDEGFPGAIALVGIYGWGFFTLRRLKRMDRFGLPVHLGVYRGAIGAALTGCFVGGLFLNMLTSEVQIWLMSVLYSLVVLCKDAMKQREPGSSEATNGGSAMPLPRFPRPAGLLPVRARRPEAGH
jgi:O-Antigen ligase